MYIDFLLVMEHPFDDTEISKFADKLKYIPQWYTDFFGKIHKRDKSSDYYRGCYATLRFLLKFKKNIDKDKIIFYSLPCVADMILEKTEQEKIFNDESNKSSASLVIGGDLFKIYFEENVDLNLIKENLINKQRKYETEMSKINSRLKNKNFVNRAPKYIVELEKINYNNLKNDIKKILLTVKSL